MSRHLIEVSAKRRVLSYWLAGGGLAFGYAMMRGSSWQGSDQLHTLMEGLAFLLALVVGAMALVRFYAKKNNTFLFIGTGFFGTAPLRRASPAPPRRPPGFVSLTPIGRARMRFD